jgi:predicted nucleic acid-binding protein
MILVDTSAWIDYFRDADTPATQRLVAALSADDNICTCGIVLTEILQGVKSDRERNELIEHFDSLIYLPMPRDAYLQAAEFYRAARKAGRTIRSTIDCLIAACAVANQVDLLDADRDFEAIAAVSTLKRLVS